MFIRSFVTISMVTLAAVVAGCGTSATTPPTATPPSLAGELIFYDWEEDMPQSVLDAFTEEYGVEVNYVPYETQEDALENMRAGEIYDGLFSLFLVLAISSGYKSF